MKSETYQLLVFCDGTNETITGGIRDTNVLKLARGLREQTGLQQHLWYEPGVGIETGLPEVSWDARIKGQLYRLSGLAFGRGIYKNIEKAIVFLAQNYYEGDEIFLFGFSRGAFTVRAVAGIINEYGLPDINNLHWLPVMIRRYFSTDKKTIERNQKVIEETRMIAGSRMPFIQFIGVWDTVEAIGFPIPGLYKKIANTPEIEGKCFLNVRHAVALDEYRYFFAPRLYTTQTGEYTARRGKLIANASLKQIAFPGCHTDIGGGRHKRLALSDITLEWMVQEARDCGLRTGCWRVSPLPYQSGITVHSEIHTTPLWAAAGQRVRDFSKNLTGDISSLHTLHYPQDTVWGRCRSVRWRYVLSGLTLFLAGLGGMYCTTPVSAALLWWQQWPVVFLENADVHQTAYTYLALDTLLLIPGLVLILSTLAGAAFANVARLRHMQKPIPHFLNWLGLGLPIYWVAALIKNLMTALAINWQGSPLFNAWLFSGLTAGLISVLGLTMVLVLLVYGAIKHPALSNQSL